MPVSADRPQEELLAIRVRHDLDLGHGRIDPVKVARALGLEVVRYPVEGDAVEGQYRPLVGGSGALFVNSRSSRLRQRFTTAHEIGHALLHPDETIVDDDLERRPNVKIERQADRFAGALLVDPTMAASVVERWEGDTGAAVAEIVSEFDVSVPTAAISLEQFGLVDRAQVSAFMRHYQETSHRRFMESHGRKSRHRPGTGSLTLDPAFKTRVTNLLARGQLSPERAAKLLGSTTEGLPENALAAHRRLAAAATAEPEFD